MTRVFGVDLPRQRQLLFVWFSGQMRGMGAGADAAGLFTLPDQHQGIKWAAPVLAVFHWPAVALDVKQG
ncbi:hypothetical protein SFPGR_26210 [Sulfuriferula plumbiphila]|nr:hypothetical protein SFPGR_26210 [Sulfuriferula plumbiphila]